jgi:phosphate-selective porin OprO and OprP
MLSRRHQIRHLIRNANVKSLRLFAGVACLGLMSNTAIAGDSADGQGAPTAAQTIEAAPAKAAKKQKSEWQLKPRWRVQYDIADIDGPTGLAGLGKVEDIRRAQIGVDLKMPNGFSARIEGDLAANPIEFTDAYLAWDGKGINVTAGQHKALTPLDDMTSDLNTSFMERASIVTAFGYGRRTGISAGYSKGDFGINAGVFTDPLLQLNDVQSNSVSLDGRAYWSPKVGKAKLHFAVAYHWRDLNDFGLATTRYRLRPQIRITDTRYIGTPALAITKEQRFGLEAAGTLGRFHGAAEIHWLNARRSGFDDPTFLGGYAEVGVFLTKDSRPLKTGTFGGIKPKKPMGSGGIGAVQFNLRYDYLDLNSKGVTGGKQDGYLASLIWTPTENFRLMGQYSKLNYADAAIAVAGDRSYAVDVIAVRFQLSY